ncbi:hypothetical protein BJ742DRAFT_840434 [Cladochytrium replicatum]|nr:hypothetical protein BJ742DRAFT_840434 [Cladochytrium replicatum]
MSISTSTSDFDDLPDLYDLLALDGSAPADSITPAKIKQAYRKAALTCHPDKVGPDDAEAALKFHQITRAQEILLSSTLRPLYESHRSAAVQRKRALAAMETKRRAGRTQLEEREEAAKRARRDEVEGKAQVERAREANLEELERIERERKQRAQRAKEELEPKAVKVKWKRKRYDFDEYAIRALFEKAYGAVDSVVTIPGKGSALVVFVTSASARAAATSASEMTGLSLSEQFEVSIVKQGAGSSKATPPPSHNNTENPSNSTSSQTRSNGGSASGTTATENVDPAVMLRRREEEMMKRMRARSSASATMSHAGS